MILVLGPTHLRTSAALPTATIRPSLLATAWARGWFRLPVQTLALVSTRSAKDCANAAGARHASTRMRRFIDKRRGKSSGYGDAASGCQFAKSASAQRAR